MQGKEQGDFLSRMVYSWNNKIASKRKFCRQSCGPWIIESICYWMPSQSSHVRTSRQKKNRTNYLCQILLERHEQRHPKIDLQAVLFSYRVSINDATGYSPYYLISGRIQTAPIDLAFPLRHEAQRGIRASCKTTVCCSCRQWAKSASANYTKLQEWRFFVCLGSQFQRTTCEEAWWWTRGLDRSKWWVKGNRWYERKFKVKASMSSRAEASMSTRAKVSKTTRAKANKTTHAKANKTTQTKIKIQDAIMIGEKDGILNSINQKIHSKVLNQIKDHLLKA